MKQVSGRELARIIQARGSRLARSQGVITFSRRGGRREGFVISIHGNQPLKTGLLRSLMKIAGLSETDL